MKTAAASLMVLMLAFTALAGFTGNFHTWTREQARRLYVSETRPAVPNIAVVDELGVEHPLGEWIKASHRVTLVEFIYTRCNAVCRALGGEYQTLQTQIRADGLTDQVRLLSISFDPAHDSPAVLARYAERLQADPVVWQFSTVKHAEQLDALLNFFGITVIPDEFGGFQHNAALLWIDADGRLTRVADFGSAEQRQWLNNLKKSAS